MVHKGLTCAYLCQVRLLMVVDLEIYVQMGKRQVVNYVSQLFVDVEKQTATITKNLSKGHALSYFRSRC